MTPTRCPSRLLVPSVLLPLLAFEPGLQASATDWGPAAQITFEAAAPYYQPVVAVVPPRTPIRWINSTASPHTVRHDGCLTEDRCAFSSIAVPPDSVLMIAPLPPGRYPYHCELHPVMRGTLVVTEPSSMEGGQTSFVEQGTIHALWHKEDSR
jgi:plastocyanin